MAKKLSTEPVDIENEDDQDSDGGMKIASNDPVESVKSSSMDIEKDSDDDTPKGQVSTVSKDIQPDGSSKIMDYHKYLINPQDLQLMQSKKNTAAAIAGIGNSLANQQSAGNFWLHQMNPHQDVSQAANLLNNAAEMPIQAKQMMLSQAQKQPQMDLVDQLNNKESMASKLVNANAIAALSQIKAKTPEQQSAYDGLKKQLASGQMSGFQVKNIFDSDPLLKESFSASIQGQKLDQTMAMMTNRLQNTAENAAQRMVNNDHVLNAYIPRLDGASKIMGLIQAGERGEFKTNKALLGQLNAEISRLETGSQSPGLNASEKTEMNDLHATLSDLRDTVTGGVSGVDLSKKFEQAKGMVGDLAKSYYQQIDDRMDTLKSGANLPGQQSVFDNKQQAMRNIYQKRFANVGMNIKGESQGASPGGMIPSANASENMVKVISPEGVSGSIPKAKLDEAIKRGFKVQ